MFSGKSRHATEFHGTLLEFATQELKDRLKKAMVFLITLENDMSPLDKEFLSSKGVLSIISSRTLAQLRQCPLMAYGSIRTCQRLVSCTDSLLKMRT